MTVQYSQKYETIKKVCLDAGFNTSPICHQILTSGRVPFLPYKRPMTKKGFFKKYEYVYDEDLDIYICPNEKDLHYKTTNREGYRVYESNPEDCEGCPFLSKCTQSKKHVKTIARHVWEADHIRHTSEWHAIYALKGLVKNQHESLIIFSCHNLKKLGLCKRRMGLI